MTENPFKISETTFLLLQIAKYFEESNPYVFPELTITSVMLFFWKILSCSASYKWCILCWFLQYLLFFQYLGCIEVFESRGIQVCEEAVKSLKSVRNFSYFSLLIILFSIQYYSVTKASADCLGYLFCLFWCNALQKALNLYINSIIEPLTCYRACYVLSL